MPVAAGLLLDVDYENNTEHFSVIRLYLRTKKGLEIFYFPEFRPYFYAIVQNPNEQKKAISEQIFGKDAFSPLKVEEVEKGNAENVLKLVFKNTEQVTIARDEIRNLKGIREVREYDIPFAKRFMIDKGLAPMNEIELDLEKGNFAKKIKLLNAEPDVLKKLKIMAFDLETYSPGRFSNPELDEILMVSSSKDGKKGEVYTYKDKKANAIVEKNEIEMIKRFISDFKNADLDMVVTYNGDMFDFPYLKDRANKLKVKFDVGADGSGVLFQRKGMDNAAKLHGIQHVDAFQLIRLLNRFQAINSVKMDLETVYESIFGIKKEKLTAEVINEIWDKGSTKEFKRLVEYNREDSVATYQIAWEFLPLLVEMGRLVKQSVYDVGRVSAGILVESLLMSHSFEKNWLIPNKPMEEEVRKRLMYSYKGGYVKAPLPGLHENIAVLDFRSLYPSIMIAHNISPETLDCKCCSKNPKHLAPTKNWFCEKRKGFLSGVLENLLEKRMAIKAEMKKAKKDSLEYKQLHARQHALKIVLNSFYGTTGYARFRWFSAESGRAITAWGRHYIRETMEKAEKAGFKAMYGDTDSTFLLIPEGKDKKDVMGFVDQINNELPGAMELEFEGMYKRGIFVTKKEGGAAKKRYALIDFENNLNIVGFEYVRRDWSKIAKETQREVLEAVLKEGDKEKAVKIVKERIKALKEGKVPNEELIVLTQIKKDIKSYAAIGPHIAAAKKAIDRGKQLGVGSVIGYIITKNGKSISDKAELEEYVKKGNYDADYYIDHQVVPAVIKIMRELGYNEDDLIHGGKQHSLSSFT